MVVVATVVAVGWVAVASLVGLRGSNMDAASDDMGGAAGRG